MSFLRMNLRCIQFISRSPATRSFDRSRFTLILNSTRHLCDALPRSNEDLVANNGVQEMLEKVSIKGNDDLKPLHDFYEYDWPTEIVDVYKRKGFKNPTPIQSNAWPIALSGKDLVGVAKTGCGKTLAFLLPAFIRAYEKGGERRPRSSPLSVIIAPTRELCQQIGGVVGEFNQIKSVSVFGGVSRMNQTQKIQRTNPELVIATPGRLIDFIQNGELNLSLVDYLVLDEADRMLDMGFEPQIRTIIERIPKERQTLMFSATWPSEVEQLARDFLKDYVQITIGSTSLRANPNIEQIIDTCHESEKIQKLFSFLDSKIENRDTKVLIFGQTKKRCEFLTRLIGRKYSVNCLHGGKTQQQRDYAINDFKRGRCNILVATDVAARGLDIDDIRYVINYDFPMTCEDYVHRIGRTARGSSQGTSYSFFTEEDAPKAKELIKILKEGKQDVSEDLINYSRSSAPVKRGQWGQYPGKQYNSNQRFDYRSRSRY